MKTATPRALAGGAQSVRVYRPLSAVKPFAPRLAPTLQRLVPAASSGAGQPNESEEQKQNAALEQQQQLHALVVTKRNSAEGTAEDAEGAPMPPRRPRSPLTILLSRIVALLGIIGQALTRMSQNPRGATIQRILAMSFVVGAIAYGRTVMAAREQAAPQEVLYSSFVNLLDSGKVRAARMEGGTDRIYFDLNPVEGEGGADAEVTARATMVGMQKKFYVKMAEKSDSFLVSRILAMGVEFSILKTSFQASLSKVFLTALALWLPLMPLFFIMKRVIDDRNSAGRKKKNSGIAENVTTTFNDVAGVDGAKQELLEVVSVMKAAKQSYSKLKVKMPSGVLLCGPPGTGKTLLAKAVAGEAGIPFIAVSASEFVEMYVGRGAARIRELFAEARKASPCVVFIDELDAVGSKRGAGYNDERDQTLNQLLTELDGFEGRTGVLFLAATNRIDVLDSALLRPGRISRKVLVPLPDEPGRREILGVHLRGVPFLTEEERDSAPRRVAAVTAGFSGAELANVVNEASMMAARREQDHVTMLELLDGVRRTRNGVDGRSGDGRSGVFSKLEDFLMNSAAGVDTSKVVKTATA